MYEENREYNLFLPKKTLAASFKEQKCKGQSFQNQTIKTIENNTTCTDLCTGCVVSS
jgi:hypothetical protein